MIINEIFYSLQGEGSLAGLPSVFIRLAGCPLRCKWCDTKYAWSQSAGTEYTTQKLLAEIKNYPANHIVITGGEPMTHEGLPDFIAELPPGKHITIETAGIKFLSNLHCDLMSISPKLSNSTPTEIDLAKEHEKHRFDAKSLQLLIENYNYQLKFVVDAVSDIEEVETCVEALHNVERNRIFLMPQAQRRDELIRKSIELADHCQRLGFSLGQRLQILLWDGERKK
jgi:7-carboxy-7-deazaguanine synthase